MKKFSLTSRVFKVGGIAAAALACLLFVLAFVLYFWLSQSANQLTQYGLSFLNDTFTGRVKVKHTEFNRKSLVLEGVFLELDSGEPLLSLERAELDFHWFRGLSRLDYMAILGDLRLHNLSLTPEIDENGRLNFAQLKSTKPKEDKPRWPWEKYFCRYDGKICLDDSSVFFRDLSRNDFCAQLDKLYLGITARPAHKAEFELSFVPIQKVNSFKPEKGKVEIKGKIRLDMAPDFDVALTLANIDLVRFNEYYKLPQAVSLLSAQFNGKLWANCKTSSWSKILEKLNYGGQIKLSQGSVMAAQCKEPIEDITLDAELISGLASIKKFSAKFAGALLTAGGKVYIWSPSGQIKDWQGRVKLDAIMPELQLRRLAKALGLKVPVSGKISTELNVDGTLRNPSAKGKIKSAKLAYADKEISQLSIDVSWKDRLLTIENLQAQAAQGNIQGSGYALFEGQKPQFAFNLNGQDISLQGISPVGGHIGQFKVSMVGTPDSPFVYGEGSGVGGFSGAASMLESASAQFMMLGDTVSLNNVRAYTNLGQASVPYASYNYKHPYLYACMQTDNLSLPSVNVPSIGPVSGTVSGSAQVMGVPTDLNSLSVCAYSRSTNLNLGNLQINDLRGAIGLDGMNVFLPQMTGNAAGGSVAASGWIGLKGGTSNLSLLARDVDIAPFAGVVNYDIPLKLNGVGDMGASWFANGSDRNNWVSLYVEGQTGVNVPVQEAAASVLPAVSTVEKAVEQTQVGLSISTPEPTPVPMVAANQVADKSGALLASAAGVASEKSDDLSLLAKHNESDSVEAMQKLGLAYSVAPGFVPFEEPNSYAAAVQGFIGKQGLGFVGWAKDLALDGRRLTQDLTLDGRLTGRFGAWGQPKDLAFSYFTAVSGSPVKLIDQHTMWLAGRGALKDGRLSLNDNVLAWNYWPRSGWEAIPHLEGSAYAFLGPEMARPLQQNGLLYSWLPKIGLVKIEGDIMLGAPLSYQLEAEAMNIDIAWLHEQNWLAQAADLLDKVNITGGQADLYAKIGSEHGVPKVLPGTWAYIPWFTAGSAENSRVFSGAASLNSEVAISQQDGGKAAMGAINFERLLVSNRARDERLFQKNGQLANYDGGEPVPSGLLQAKGSFDNGKATLNIKAKDWSSHQAMALLPSLEEHRNMLSGWLGTDELNISFDTSKGLLDTLSMEGSMYFHNGHLLLADGLIPIDKLSAQVSRNSDKLVFSDLSLQSGDFLFQGSGWRNSAGRLETNLYAKDIVLDKLSYFDPSLSDLHGKANLALCVESDDPSFRAVQAVFAMEGKDVTWGSVPVSLYFPDFRMGFINYADNGELYTSKGAGIAANYKNGRIYVNIPTEAVKFSAYRYFEKALLPKVVADRLQAPEDKEQKGFRPHPALDTSGNIIGARLDKDPVSFAVAGDFNFSPSFTSEDGNWFLGPNGPEFGNDEQPLTFSLQNFQGNMARAALGLPMSQRRFSFSGELGLKGQWYRGHLAEAPAGSLRYNFDISQLAFGSVTVDEAENIEKAQEAPENEEKMPRRILWRGLTLKQNLKGAYSREEKVGRFIIEPFEFVPERRSFGPEGKDEEKASGNVSGSVNLALTRLPGSSRNRLNQENEDGVASDKGASSSNGSGNGSAAVDANEVHFRVSQVPISELGSFLFPSLNSGFVENFVLNASGPVYSPVFNMLFNVTNGKAGNLNLASITGAVSGSRDPQSKIYQVRLGTAETNFRNERIKNIVSQGLQELGDVSDYAEGIKVYFGSEKRADRVFSISGTLPYEVSRVKPKENKSLVPFWQGTSASLDGAVDINAVLKDKDLGLISSVVSDVAGSAGNMLGSLHIGGTLMRPEVVGELKVVDGQIEHKKAGTVSSLNIDANFSEILDPELKNKYIEEKKRNYIAERGMGAVLAEHLSRKAQENSQGQNSSSAQVNTEQKGEQNSGRETFDPLDFSEARFNRFELRKFTGMLGDKPFVVKGRADMDGFTPMDVDLAFSGEQLPLRWGSLFEGRADVDLHLSKAEVNSKDMASWKESLRSRAIRPKLGASSSKQQTVPIPKLYYLSGKIAVPRGDVSVDVSTLTSSSGESFDWSKLPVDYRINVNIGEDVWMHALGCRIRAAGDLAVVPDEDTGKPVIDGEVDLSRGLLAIPLYDLKFKVRSGKAIFNHSQMPELQDVTADAQVDDYEVTAFVSGAYPNIKVEFVSNPPLAEKEIQNLLALGGFTKYTPSNSGAQMVHAPGNTTGSQAVSTDLNLSTSGISMLSKILSSPLTQEISRMLFLSDFSVDITSPHGYSFKIAKSIDAKDRFLFTLTRSLNTQTGQDESVYGIEWRFKNNMLFRLGFDQDGDVRPWFQGFWEF